MDLVAILRAICMGVMVALCTHEFIRIQRDWSRLEDFIKYRIDLEASICKDLDTTVTIIKLKKFINDTKKVKYSGNFKRFDTN